MLEKDQVALIIVTILTVLGVVFLIILFTVFQRRKNKLLLEREENKKKYEEGITATQIEIREETLRNISWELHDNIGQLLTLAKIQMQHASIENIDEISEVITKSLNEVRALSKSINPDFIRKINFKEALKLELDRFDRLKYIESDLIITGEEIEVNEKHGIIIFRILQEFLSNTIKHSKASKLTVSISYKKTTIEIIAKDDGVGFKTDENTQNGIGLQNIKARAKLINAEVKMKSAPQKGTSLIINYYI